MATRIEQILRLARQTLGDKEKERWSDQDLIDLLDLGHKDYAHHANLLRGVYTIPLQVGVAVYTLPDDVFMITRAEFDQCKIALTSYDRMDEQGAKQVINDNSYNSNYTKSRANSDFSSDYIKFCWEETTGSEPEALVYDQGNLGEVRVYPIPDDSSIGTAYTFTNESGVDPFEGSELYGVVTAITDYSISTVYGVLTDLYDPAIKVENFQEIDGVTTAIGLTAGNIVIRYVKTPDTLLNTSDQLSTPRAFDTGLKYFIVGHALRNDLDVRNTERGNSELALYDRELELAKHVSSQNGVRSTQLSTTYRNCFE